MPKATRTKKRILPFSLCKKVQLSVPQGWEELTQEQLRYVVRILWLYREHEAWEETVQATVFCRLSGIRVLQQCKEGYICAKGRKRFVLDRELLPVLVESVAWVTRTEEMTVRIEQAGNHTAVDFKLQQLPFGEYLQLENYYQALLATKDERHLLSMARILYQVPDGTEEPELKEELLMGVFLWCAAVKQLLAQWFPHFLRPSGEAGKTVTQEDMRESTQAQIRLLTKGDVTKQKYILEETDTWTALAELDALAREAEEIERRTNGKK